VAIFPKKKKGVDPRKPVSGTTIVAEGTTATPPPSMAEAGSSRVSVIRDVVPQLASRQTAVRAYRQMVSNDASCYSSLRVAKVPVLSADYYIEPFSDNQEDVDIAEFVDFNIFHRPSAPWLLTMEEILHMYEDGFSVLETVMEPGQWAPSREHANRKNYTMLKKLAPRPAPSIDSITYDNNGGPVAILQNAIQADGSVKKVTIPIGQCVVFTLTKRGSDLMGESILRSAYKHWFYKDHLYKVDAIQKERHGIGIPDVKLLPGASNEDKATATDMARNLRANESAYVVRPVNIEVGFLKPEGQLVNVLDSALHHDNMIMKNVMAQFMNLGLEAGGGRATAGSQVDIFMKSLRHVANLICETINIHLIPQLVAYNFPTDRFPRMQARNIGETKDTQAWASALANLFARSAITPDLDTEQWIRRQLDMPAKKGPYHDPMAQPANDPFGNANAGNGNGKGDVSNATKNGNTGAPVNAA
jgi:hypothetical protein